MPNLPPDTTPLDVQGVQGYLKEILPESELATAPSVSGYEPILLLRTSHIMAGFAFSNGDMRKSFNILYSNFKKQYTDQRSDWDPLDLAFVFCVSPEERNLDRFCSRVETDTFFCRKFVVPLSRPLNESLARLPFLPLAPLRGLSLRPPSAQTFLRECGVSTVLSRYLVVQRERSPEGIVDDCLSGTFGERRALRGKAVESVSPVERQTAPIRALSITIKNFRAYRKEQTLEFGDDVTVLYGPNGFGKTSLFDALDFAATGEIGRLGTSGDAHFRRLSKHLDSGNEESVVSLALTANGAVRRLTRKVADRKNAILDGIQVDRKRALVELTDSTFPPADRVENLIKLFRATHLFSQEHQEFARDFQDDCELSEEVVSRLLALEDFSNAAKKVGSVQEIIRAAINRSVEMSSVISQQLADERVELEGLTRKAQPHKPAGAIEDVLNALRERLRGAGIQATSVDDDLSTVRSWRALIEAQRADAEIRAVRLRGLVGELRRTAEARANLGAIGPAIEGQMRKVSELDLEFNSVNQEVQRTEASLAELTVKNNQLMEQRQALEAVQIAAPQYRALRDREKELQSEVARLRSLIEQSNEQLNRQTADLNAAQGRATIVQRGLTTHRDDLRAATALAAALESWLHASDRMPGTRQALERSSATLRALAADEQQVSERLEALAHQKARLLQLSSEFESEQSELKKLLSQLQQHVASGTCPLCGEDHGSRENLLARIRRQFDREELSPARADLQAINAQESLLTGQLENLRHALRSEQANRQRLEQLQRQLNTEVEGFEASARALKIDVSDGQVPSQIHALVSRLRSELSQRTSHLAEIEADLRQRRDHIAVLQSEIEAHTKDLQVCEHGLARVGAEIAGMISNSRLIPPLDTTDDDLKALEAANAAEQSTLQRSIDEQRARLEQSAQRSASLRRQLNAERETLARLREEGSRDERSVKELEGMLENAAVPLRIDEDSLRALADDAARSQARLEQLRDATEAAELAIDAATTAAALGRLRQSIKNRERSLEAARVTKEQYDPWLDYFQTISDLISQQQREAIRQFTSLYGPRTSVIQRRLRAVYGFDDVDIQTHGTAIRVRVRRRDEELKPTEYFSQSQQQTLLLGLFLTACLSQTWSALSPVFLDDPVTHFDDLNTYAFLDLVVGLLESDVGRRQFVISTCDEKFLHLARQKFRHLGNRARYYVYSAIGAEGPLVQELTGLGPNEMH